MTVKFAREIVVNLACTRVYRNFLLQFVLCQRYDKPLEGWLGHYNIRFGEQAGVYCDTARSAQQMLPMGFDNGANALKGPQVSQVLEAEMNRAAAIIDPVQAASPALGLVAASIHDIAEGRMRSHLSLVHTPTARKGVMSDREIDLQLVEKAQKGDKRAFELLVIKYQKKLERLLSRVMRDQDEIADVAQETFIKAYRALGSFRGDSAFYTWLYRIGINTAKNHLVSMGRRAPTTTEFNAEDAEGFEDAELLHDNLTPESALATKQIAQTVNDAIEELPEELRTAITLREIEGLAYEEIAALMNCPIGTVRSRIFRARESVAKRLRPQLGTALDQRW
jgi:RNA polymerase sigma-70 factor, ECF subfamily